MRTKEIWYIKDKGRLILEDKGTLLLSSLCLNPSVNINEIANV